MKKFFKVILPPFAGFLLYFLAVRYSGVYFDLQISEMGEGTVKAFMAYYRYFMPLLFIVGVLTQLLIVIPVWEKARRYQNTSAKIADWAGLLFICLLFASGISYLISDPKHNFQHFVHVALFMTGIQMAYWLINILILYLLGPRLKKPEEAKDTDESGAANH